MHFTKDFEDFIKKTKKLKVENRLREISELEFPFIDVAKRQIILSMPTYERGKQPNIIVASKNEVFVYSEDSFKDQKEFISTHSDKIYGESTATIFALIKKISVHYSNEFSRIRGVMNQLDLHPHIDEVEKIGKALRSLTDRFEELVRFMILLKERDVPHFDTSLFPTDYELLSSEVRYGLERCRSHVYRIASLRTKSEMQSNRELNQTMKRLTVITTFLAIVSIVVSVPGTIGAIFGIPALSEVYFRESAQMLVVGLILATLISIILGIIYWKWLRLTRAI